MSKPQPPSDVDFIARMIAEIDAERIGALSEEALLEEMRDADLEPERPVDVEKWLADADAAQTDDAKTAPVIPLPGPRRRPAVLRMSIIAIAACVAGVFIDRTVLDHGPGRGPEVARHDTTPPPKHDTVPTTTTATTTTATAKDPHLGDKLRAAAGNDCVVGSFETCELLLDAAKEIDPFGELGADVQRMRKQIKEGMLKREQRGDRYNAKP